MHICKRPYRYIRTKDEALHKWHAVIDLSRDDSETYDFCGDIRDSERRLLALCEPVHVANTVRSGVTSQRVHGTPNRSYIFERLIDHQ
jgi:hypothetical protein